jgi:predicted Kef-type K+ transport protein
MEVALFVTAFLFGFVAKAVGLPPLVGYLVAGFILHAFGYEATEGIDVVAEIGILLLLFGIGLKLRPRTLARPSVWATATVFAAVATGLVGALLLAVGALGVPLEHRLRSAGT